MFSSILGILKNGLAFALGIFTAKNAPDVKAAKVAQDTQNQKAKVEGDVLKRDVTKTAEDIST